MDPTSPRLLDQLLEITVLLGRDMGEHLTTLGLTESRAHVLHVLHATGPCPQRRLAEALDVAPRTITGLVDGLVASGHVTREPHPGDRRATLVTPTPRGAAVMADLDRDGATLEAQLTAGVAPDLRPALADGLAQVLATLRDLAAEAGRS